MSETKNEQPKSISNNIQIDENFEEFHTIKRGKSARNPLQNNDKDIRKPIYYANTKNFNSNG